MKFGTKNNLAGQKADPSTGAIMTPIYQTSTYKQDGPGNLKDMNTLELATQLEPLLKIT